MSLGRRVVVSQAILWAKGGLLLPKILPFLALAAGITLAFRVINHHWPTVGIAIGVLAGGTYHLWAWSRKQSIEAV